MSREEPTDEPAPEADNEGAGEAGAEAEALGPAQQRPEPERRPETEETDNRQEELEEKLQRHDLGGLGRDTLPPEVRLQVLGPQASRPASFFVDAPVTRGEVPRFDGKEAVEKKLKQQLSEAKEGEPPPSDSP
jgi:hypothetical protein